MCSRAGIFLENASWGVSEIIGGLPFPPSPPPFLALLPSLASPFPPFPFPPLPLEVGPLKSS